MPRRPSTPPTAATAADVLKRQLEYYEARAGEYDEWFLRQGRYDRGEASNRLWFEETAQVERWLRSLHPGGDVLELACGTGQWTKRLLEKARSVTVVDGSAEMLRVHERQVESSAIVRIQADLFSWRPARTYDLVFFGFWLSHVPLPLVDELFRTVRGALRPDGRFCLVDSRYHEESTARDHRLADSALGVQERRLNDGRTFQVVKIFWPAAELVARLESLGFLAEAVETDHFFLCATGTAPRPEVRLS
jgi:demethylmenaquinone methyltransferase/2-methoxy-6-polyprenyl-1,4-benzoquinol methylase